MLFFVQVRHTSSSREMSGAITSTYLASEQYRLLGIRAHRSTDALSSSIMTPTVHVNAVTASRDAFKMLKSMPLPIHRKLLDCTRSKDITACIIVGFNSVLVDAGSYHTAGMLM